MGYEHRNRSAFGDEFQFASVGLEFLWAELTIGSTFAGLARGAADDSEKRLRLRRQAQEAYDTVLSFLPRLPLTAEERRQVAAALEALRQDIDVIPIG